MQLANPNIKITNTQPDEMGGGRQFCYKAGLFIPPPHFSEDGGQYPPHLPRPWGEVVIFIPPMWGESSVKTSENLNPSPPQDGGG